MLALSISEKAAAQIGKIRDGEEADEKYLRIAVIGGGCSGNEYQMGFDTEKDGDTSVESGGVKVIVDAESAPKLAGLELDFHEGLDGSSFVFNNPNATGGCGCGKSFSV